MVVVCKNVTTPGGLTHHVVIVNENTLNNAEDDQGNAYTGTLPFSWTDAHGQSQNEERSVATRFAGAGEQAERLDPAEECGGGSGSQDECDQLPGVQPDGFECSKGSTTRDVLGSRVNCDLGVRESWKDVYTTSYTFDQDDNDWDALPETGPVRQALPPTALTEEELEACDGGDGGLDDITVAVDFIDPGCDDLGAASWTGTMNSIVDYVVKGKPGLGQTVTVSAVIEAAQADKYQFKPGSTTSFTHTYPTVAELDCVLGEETVVPEPRPDKNPTKASQEPTVKGVQVVVPQKAAPEAAPGAAVPTAVAAGVGGGEVSSSLTQLMSQMLLGGGMLLLLAGGWVGLGRREAGAHEA